jgi:hypothetical protein
MKMLDKIKPKTKLSGYLNSMNFEKFMNSMEEDMEQEGVPDVLKLKWIVEWFSGEALTIVVAQLNNNVNEDASVTLSSIKDALQDAYGVEDRDFCANAIITQLVKGEPIPMGDFKKTQSFIINIEHKYELAKGRDKLAKFDIKYMYTQVLSAEWQREIKNKSYSFRDFTKFVRRTAREQEEIVENVGRDEGKPGKATV